MPGPEGGERPQEQAMEAHTIKRNITAMSVTVPPPEDLSFYEWLELTLNGGEPVVMSSLTVQVLIHKLATAIGAQAVLEFSRAR